MRVIRRVLSFDQRHEVKSKGKIYFFNIGVSACVNITKCPIKSKRKICGVTLGLLFV